MYWFEEKLPSDTDFSVEVELMQMDMESNFLIIHINRFSNFGENVDT